MANLMIGHDALFGVGQDGALLLRARDDKLKGRQQILLVDSLAPHAHGAQRRLVDEVGKVCADRACGRLCNLVQIDILGQLDIFRVDAQRLVASGEIGSVDDDAAVETAGAQQDAKARGAHLRMEVAGHDFGDVPRKGGDLVREFTFTNDGTAPLVVTRVITSCSCLKASFPKRPVPPGGQGVIRITYEPHKSEPGVFNKVIQVYSNSVDGRDVITVQGNSIDTPPRKIKTDKVKVKYK